MVNFFVGAFLSALCGYLGMSFAVRANIRTTLACQGKDGLNNGLKLCLQERLSFSVSGSLPPPPSAEMLLYVTLSPKTI